MKEKIHLNLGCSCMTLTSASGKHYLFRTCDLNEISNKESFQVTRHEKNKEIVYSDGHKEVCHYNIIGISYTDKKSWLLDGINEAGLCGGLLMLPEGTSVQAADKGKQGCMGMELVTKLLSCCKNVTEAKEIIAQIQLTDIIYGNQNLKATVHFFFCDVNGKQLILEACDIEHPGIIQIYESGECLGIMTNSPPFPKQKENLWWFLAHSPIFKNDNGSDILKNITLDGKPLKPDSEASHLLSTSVFPGGYSSFERFVRLALLKALNYSGNTFTDEKMLALGSGIMNTVREPEHQGLLHLSLDMDTGEYCHQNSKTYYLVMYDLSNRKFHLLPHDEVVWSEYML